jgi:hypothetical protein
MKKKLGLIMALLLIVTLVVSVIPAMAGVDPDFGNNSMGSASYPTGTAGITSVLGNVLECQGVLDAQKITIPCGGAWITSVRMYFSSITGNGQSGGQLNMAIYNATFSLVPGSVTGASTVSATGWKTHTYSTPFFLSGGTYWLAYQTSNKAPMRNYDNSGSNSRAYYAMAWGAFPNSYTPNYIDNLRESMYTSYVQAELGVAKATKATLPTNGNISSVSFYSHATGNVRLAIYSDGASPSSLQWESASTPVSQNAWTTVSISAGTPSSLSLCCGNYWLAWQWDSANSGPSYTAGSAGDGNYICQAYGAFPSPWSGGTSSSETWSIYASYEILTYNLTTAASPPAGGTVTPGGSYNCCTDVPINATANSGWSFTGWTTDGDPYEIANAAAAQTTIFVDKNKTVTANFAECTHNLTVESDGCCPIEVSYGTFVGTVGAGASTNFTIPCNTNVTLTAADSSCCVFDNWTGDVPPGTPNTTNPIIILMNGDKSVTAHCTPLGPYSLTVTSDGCCPIDVSYGSVIDTVPAGGSTTYEDIPCGTDVTLTADDSDADCQFDNWTGNVPGSTNYTNPITIHIDSNKTVTGNCEEILPPPPVGGEAYPVNKLAILAPWIALAAIIAGALIYMRRRQAQS